MDPIDFRQLGAMAKVSICWGFLWRSLVIGLAAGAAGSLLGALVGLVVGGTGEQASVLVLSGLFSLVLGCISLYVYVRWLLTSRLGKYRLVLVLSNQASQRSFEATTFSDTGLQQP